MYTDQREKHVAIKSLSVGDVLEASFRWNVHDAMAPNHFWLDHNYERTGICLKEMIEIDVPVSYTHLAAVLSGNRCGFR